MPHDHLHNVKDKLNYEWKTKINVMKSLPRWDIPCTMLNGLNSSFQQSWGITETEVVQGEGPTVVAQDGETAPGTPSEATGLRPARGGK